LFRREGFLPLEEHKIKTTLDELKDGQASDDPNLRTVEAARRQPRAVDAVSATSAFGPKRT
jgi:hypothetical protein